MEQINEAVTQEVHTEGGKRLKKGGKGPLIALAVLVLLLAGAYVGACAYVSSLNTFAPNRQVNGVEIGGLTVEQAQQKLEQTLLGQSVEIHNAERDLHLTVTLADLGYSQESFAGDAQFWMDADRSQPFLLQAWDYFCYWTGRYPGGSSWPDADEAALSNAVREIAAQFSWEPVDGDYALLEDAVTITRFKDGCRADEAALKEALVNAGSYSQNGYQVEILCETIPAKVVTAQEVHSKLAAEMKNSVYDKETRGVTEDVLGVSFSVSEVQKLLDATEPGKTVDIGAQIEHPVVTTEVLKEVMFRDVLGENRTHVSGTSARINNVKLSASAINGYVMNPGDVFSYNEVVGKRTAERGYEAAPAYIRGETVDEIGGGICQTSSTLYLSCLLSNLEITERYAHRYVPAYIPWGMDATVSWGGPDYKFTNDTDYPIKIVTEYSKNYLTVKILGTNVDGSYAKMDNEVLSTTPWETVYEEDATLAPGTPDKEKTTPYTGYKVKTYHTIYDKNGNVIDKHYEATSDYKVRNRVIVRAPAAPTTPAVVTPVAPVVPVVNPGQIYDDIYEELPVTPTVPEVWEEPEVPVEPELPDDVFWSDEGIL